MAVLLGVDTGGTFTDAVLLRDETEVIASAKSLTTRSDLAEGIGKAVAAVLAASRIKPEEIAMASLSTTLATNALVEGQGGRVGLVSWQRWPPACNQILTQRSQRQRFGHKRSLKNFNRSKAALIRGFVS